MSKPLISLITVCYNAESLLFDTLSSAINQTYKHIELVIVDGGSKDKTVEVAKQFQSYIGTLISEKDKGIYDAMNKGIKAAKGEWIYFLNAGDSFYSNTILEEIFDNTSLEGIDFLYGKMQTVNEPTGVNYIAGKAVTFKDFYFSYPICHQTTFTRKKVFEYMPMLDTQLKIMSDNKWQMTFFRTHEAQSRFLDKIIAYYDIQGASYHKRMLGYREFLSYTKKLLPFHVYLINLLLYPVIWSKVKFIRTFQETAWFKAYRNMKFKGKTVNV